MSYSRNVEIIFIDCIDFILVLRTDPEYFLNNILHVNEYLLLLFAVEAYVFWELFKK